MSFICAISNEVPQQAVVSPVSGAVFEKRLIEKFISENGKDPLNGESLSVEQLIEIKGQEIIKPRPPTATSIPAILKMLQDEWDATMLHSFTLRQQLQTARQELSHALYQHDAACRVIARLSKEVKAAREALNMLKPQGALPTAVDNFADEIKQTNVDHPMEEFGTIPDSVKNQIEAKAKVLMDARKQRGKNIPEELAKIDEVKTYAQVAAYPSLHSASIPGITSLDIHEQDHNLIVTGGNDKTAVVFNKSTEQVVATLKGHQKKIENVVYHPKDADVCVTCSLDSTVRVWNIGQQNCQHVIQAHDAPVTGLSLHATGDYVLSVSLDEKWAFSDIRTGRVLCRVASDEGGASQKLTSAQFHPDGLIFGVGTARGVVKIWNLNEQSPMATLEDHTGAIKSIAFSENGYYLATSAEDSCVKLWDLRKIPVRNFKTLKLDDKYEIRDLSFDRSGLYLAVAGTDVRVYHTKQWQELCVLSDHPQTATGVRFGNNASFLATAGQDRFLRFFSTPENE
uniref:Pre-mRNA-processing factor 19 n=1 Tax=Romanomermis culicivorax TaxID=13658 RepID=A0A915JIC2_ROMCU